MKYKLTIETDSRTELNQLFYKLQSLHTSAVEGDGEANVNMTAAEPAVTNEAPAVEPPAGTDIDMDSNGTPWLEEVHATTKTTKADGTWKKKRGVDDEVVEAAEKAAREKLNGLPTPAENPPVETEQTTEEVVDYAQVVTLYQELVAVGKITPEQVTAIYSECGTNGAEIATDETARATVYKRMLEFRDDAPAAPDTGLPA